MNFTKVCLICLFLFFFGSICGWMLEVVFRRFVSAKKWINPGFLTGPCLPIYGFGVVGLFGISLIPIHTGYAWLDAVLVILLMGVTMTLIEYLAGLIFIKGMKIRLWDYSDRKGNIQGIICPLFSFFWLLVSAIYYFFITPEIIEMVTWFVNHIEFAFVVGVCMGVLIVDFGHSMQLTYKIRRFAQEHQIVVHFEKLKETLYEKAKEAEEKHPGFLFPFKRLSAFKEQLIAIKEKFASPEAKQKKDAPQGDEAASERD